MPYESRRCRKAETLTAEETEVEKALVHYETVLDNGDIDLTEFVPTRVLYATYRHFRADRLARCSQYVVDPDLEPVPLTVRQFGAALRRVWPDMEAYHVRRRCHGVQVRGFVGVRGPDSCTVRDDVGRPRRDS